MRLATGIEVTAETLTAQGFHLDTEITNDYVEVYNKSEGTMFVSLEVSEGVIVDMDVLV